MLHLGSASTIRYLYIYATTLSEDLRRAFPEFHAFKRCDSTSTFAGKRKLKCLNILRSDERFLDALSLLGERQDVNETVGETLEEFTCRIYSKKTSVSINEARYEVFRKKKAMPDPHMLPPFTRCLEDTYRSDKFPDNGTEECTITTFSSQRPKKSRLENNR